MLYVSSPVLRRPSGCRRPSGHAKNSGSGYLRILGSSGSRSGFRNGIFVDNDTHSKERAAGEKTILLTARHFKGQGKMAQLWPCNGTTLALLLNKLTYK